MPPGRQPQVVQTSPVPAPSEDVWRRAVSPEGINHALGPWLRMTMPSALAGRTIDDVPLGEPLGRSWILLFGVNRSTTTTFSSPSVDQAFASSSGRGS